MEDFAINIIKTRSQSQVLRIPLYNRGNEIMGNVEIALTRVELGSFRNYRPVKEPRAFHHETIPLTYKQHVNTTSTGITTSPYSQLSERH